MTPLNPRLSANGPKLAPIEKLPDTKDPLNPQYLIDTIKNGKSGVGGYGQMPPKGGDAKLTDKGHKRLDTASKTHLASVRDLFRERFSEDELETLASLLERLPQSPNGGC